MVINSTTVSVEFFHLKQHLFVRHVEIYPVYNLNVMRIVNNQLMKPLFFFAQNLARDLTIPFSTALDDQLTTFGKKSHLSILSHTSPCLYLISFLEE